MYIALLVIFLLVSILLIATVMLYQGKGASMGTSFGLGASTTLFGSSGSGNFITRMTAIFSILFFVISLVLGNLSFNKDIMKSKWENIDKSIDIEKSIERSASSVSSIGDIDS